MTHLILAHPEEGTGSRTFGVHRERDFAQNIHVPKTTNPSPTQYVYPRLCHDHLTLYIWTIRSPGGLSSSSFTEYLISMSNSREFSPLFLHEKVPTTMVPS